MRKYIAKIRIYKKKWMREAVEEINALADYIEKLDRDPYLTSALATLDLCRDSLLAVRELQMLNDYTNKKGAKKA